MSENTQASVGQILRDAREAQGMSLDDAAMRLRLMQRQVAAMETDDFESLGQAVFARGFVRNYARLLGLAPESLLARMHGAPAEPAAVTQAEPPLPSSWLTSPWLILLSLGLLVGVAVPVALYLWLNSEVDEGPGNQTSPAVQVDSAPAAEPMPAAASTDTATQAAPTDTATQAAPGEPGVAAADAGEAGATVAPDETAATSSVLHLEFGAEAWTEIKDASGHMLHRQLNPAGSSIDVSGQPPFELVIGNAAQARLTYNGRPIDLKPFTESMVARFTLEE
jgi:cytoskeleton protein RodZ